MGLTPTANWLALALLTTLLAGCATSTGTLVPDAAWEQRRASLSTLDYFKANGKIALRTLESSDSASMIWVQSGKSSQVNLSGPLGAGATTLHSDGTTVTVSRDGDVTSYDIDSYETIDEWGIPVGSVRYWALGIPDPSLEADTLSVEDNLLRTLTQSGWTITYTRYDQSGGFTLPTRMQLVKGDSQLRIIVSSWSLSAPE